MSLRGLSFIPSLGRRAPGFNLPPVGMAAGALDGRKSSGTGKKSPGARYLKMARYQPGAWGGFRCLEGTRKGPERGLERARSMRFACFLGGSQGRRRGSRAAVGMRLLTVWLCVVLAVGQPGRRGNFIEQKDRDLARKADQKAPKRALWGAVGARWTQPAPRWMTWTSRKRTERHAGRTSWGLRRTTSSCRLGLVR